MNDQVIAIAAPVDTDSFGRGGDLARQSVFRIVSRELGTTGTGFLHKSGNIVTAEHVVRNTRHPLIILSDGRAFEADVINADADLDLGVLKPSFALAMALIGQPLPISSTAQVAIGTQVSTWGFPGGYQGTLPLLSTGVLSGLTEFRRQSGVNVRQWVVNAAFNSGNSGGPLLHIESGEVIGLVSSKLAPISPTSQSFLAALAGNSSGFVYTAQTPDGKSVNLSEGQIVAHILNELRGQVQLVIGMAALLPDIQAFLKKNGIDP